jgi:hypothetical protein
MSEIASERAPESPLSYPIAGLEAAETRHCTI